MNVLRSLQKFNKTPSLFITCQRFSSSGSFVNVIENEETRTANLVLQRPPVNSLSMEFLDQIKAAIEDLESKKYRGCIISSSSPTVFCAGLDITELYKPEEKRVKAFWRSLQNMFKTLYKTPLITVAAINGHAPAGGCMMALCCDHRLMLNGKGTIGLNEVLLGIMAPKWFQRALVDNIGFREAEKALVVGSLFTPEKALSLGLIDKIVSSPDELMTEATNYLSATIEIPAHAYIATKMNLRRPLVEELNTYQEEEINNMAQSVRNEAMVKALGKYFDHLKSKNK